MDAPTLRQVFDAVYLLMLGAWSGAAALVLLVLPPVPAPDDGWTRRVLGRFYTIGATCGAVALPAAVCARLAFPEYRTPWFALQSLGLIGLTLPMIGGAARPASRRDAGDPPPLDVLRVRLGILMAGLAVLAVAQALRPPPRTRGIVERQPGGAALSRPPSLPTPAGETPPGSLH